MNVAYFISKRIAINKDSSFTKVIIRIAITAITLNVAIMILTTSIITGFKKEISDKIFGFWGHVHITDGNINRNFDLRSLDKNLPFVEEVRNIKFLEYAVPATVLGINIQGKEKIKKTYGGVSGAYPFIILPGLLTTNEDFYGILVKGIDNNYDAKRIERFLISGRMLRFPKDSSSAELLLSKNIADKLSLSVGDKTVLNFLRNNNQIKRRFEIVGIYNTGLEEYDKRFCLADLTKVQEILNWQPNEVQGLEVVLEDVRDMDIVSDYIYYEVLPQKYYAESIRSKFPSIFEWLNLQDINEKIILILMILVAIINMITVLLILILERTHMIGIVKALGMTNREVRWIFLYNAAFIIGIGLVLGNIIGLTISILQQQYGFIKLDEANYYLDTAPILVKWSSVLAINVGTMAVSLLFLIIPTFLVTKITPVSALKFQ